MKCLVRTTRSRSRWLVTLLLAGAIAGILGATPLEAQTFNSTSNGSDGAYTPSGSAGTVVTFDPSQFSGTQVASNIFNFTTITVPAGVTVRLGGDKIKGPVYWLAQGSVDIEGTIDLSGGNGYDATNNAFLRVPSMPGAGGYPGGVGGNSSQPPMPGGGPGGGAVGVALPNQNACQAGRGGQFSGNQFLIPLVGGSGGGGGAGNFVYCQTQTYGPGGGAGGGALLIAAAQIVISGSINANGGQTGYYLAGNGSGGAIRLVANTIDGNGTLSANGCPNSCGGGDSRIGSPGIIRLEAFSIQGGISNQSLNQSGPFPLLLPTAGPQTAQVISINGIGLTPNPNSFPDVTLNTASSVPVVIQTHNIPPTAAVNLTILNQNGVPDTVIPAPPLGNCNQDNFCTTTVNVIFPFGASRGLTKVTWTP